MLGAGIDVGYVPKAAVAASCKARAFGEQVMKDAWGTRRGRVAYNFEQQGESQYALQHAEFGQVLESTSARPNPIRLAPSTSREGRVAEGGAMPRYSGVNSYQLNRRGERPLCP